MTAEDILSDLTEAEEAFLEEIEEDADHSWSFFSGRESFTLFEFMDLADDEKLACTVVRADGTILSMDNRIDGKLFGNVMI